MIPGGSFGPAGQRSIEHTGEASEVRTPWHIFRMSCRVDAILIASIYAAAFVALCTAWGIVEAAQGLSFWHALWAGVQGAFRVVRWFASVPILAWLYRICHHARLLVHHRWEPEQMDPYAHQPYEARAPETRGRTYWDDYADWDRKPQKPETEPSRIPPVIIRENERSTINAGVPPRPEQHGDDKLVTLLRSVMARTHPFSRRGAVANGLYSRREWESLETWAIEQGFHDKGTGELTPRGKRWAVATIERVRDNGQHSPTPVGERDDGQ